MSRRFIVLLTFVLLFGTFSATAQDSTEDRLEVIATYSILGDVVQNVAGDAANVTVIMPANVDPHSYEPSPQVIIGLSRADVVFSNGMRFEESLVPIIEAQGDNINHVIVSQCVPIWSLEAHEDEGDDHEEAEHHHTLSDLVIGESAVAVQCGAHYEALTALHSGELPHYLYHAEGPLYAIDCGLADDHEHAEGEELYHGVCDPHVWMDPNNVILWTYLIRDTLSTLDPAHADVFAANADRYAEELAQTAHQLFASLETIPQENRVLIANHQSFGYITNPHHFAQVAAIIPGGSTAGEPSAADLVDLINVVRETGVSAIFFENTVTSDLAERIAEESDATIYMLYTGSLGDADSPAATYLDLITYNITTITEALGGEMIGGEA